MSSTEVSGVVDAAKEYSVASDEKGRDSKSTTYGVGEHGCALGVLTSEKKSEHRLVGCRSSSEQFPPKTPCLET